LISIKAQPAPRCQVYFMEPSENPPEERNTAGDRLSDVSAGVWWLLGAVTVVMFIVLAFWLTDVMNP